MPKFTEVLKNRNFLLLWVGQIISQLGDRLGQMSLIALVSLKAGNSTIEIAKILSFTIIPVFIIGPLAGAYVDRWDRRRTMYASDFLRAALILIIPFFFFPVRIFTPIYLVIFIVFCIGRFFVPAKLSIVPDLVEKKQLLMANSLVNITGMIAAILGFGISGVLVERLGAKGGLYLDSLSFLLSALLIFFIAKKPQASLGIRKVSQEIVEVIRKSVFQEVKEGVLYFFKNKNIRFSAAIMFILSSALGGASVVLITFIQDTFNSLTRDLGLLGMFLGAGLFLGSLVYGRFGHRVSHYKIIFASITLSGMILAAFALVISRYPYFFAAAALSLVMGFFVSPVIIATNTIIHHVSENDMMGKTFSSLEIVTHLGFIIFMFIGGFFARRFSHVSILIAAGALFVVLGVVNLAYQRKIPWLN
ncbi:MAG: MFS transporter [Candidatus Omnitrophota bacterium]|jgi:MFS family permease